MNLRTLQTIFFFMLILFSSSCTLYKNVPYFQDLQKDSISTEKINNFSPLIIQPGDLLAINVTSLNHDADAIINYNLERPAGSVFITPSTTNEIPSAGSPNENTVYGYLVDKDGNINIPMVGILKVSGLTTEEISRLLETSLQQYLSQPVVNVRMQNFKISILGDVLRPNSYVVTNERITLTEALSLAGDLNTTGLRKNVVLIREFDGKRQYIPLDLTSRKIFTSPYYYLKNNDVIYVQPNREKVESSDTTLGRTSLIISALSVVAILISILKK